MSLSDLITTGEAEKLSNLHRRPTMARTYIWAPNFTTGPYPNGPIKLGHILSDLNDFSPLNREGVVEVPANQLNPAHRLPNYVFDSTKGDRSDLKFMISCDTLETTDFEPTTSYIEESMDVPEVQLFMQACNFKLPVYMVTGLKVARGIIQGSKPFTSEGNINFTNSTDFIVGFRVHRIWYRRHYHASHPQAYLCNPSLFCKRPSPTLHWDGERRFHS